MLHHGNLSVVARAQNLNESRLARATALDGIANLLRVVNLRSVEQSDQDTRKIATRLALNVLAQLLKNIAQLFFNIQILSTTFVSLSHTFPNRR